MTVPMVLIRNDAATSADYSRLYREARRAALRMDVAARQRIAAIYESAAEDAARIVRDGLERGLSELTTARWSAIESSLRDAAAAIARGSQEAGESLVEATAGIFPEMNADWLMRAVQLAGAEQKVTREGLALISGSIESRVVASLASRLWADGKTFSDSVWGNDGLRADWYERLRMTIAGGIAQGRDPAKIAKDIQVYSADGKLALLQRWGALERGTAEFTSRLPGRIDWRAVRLVRSEFNASLQDSQGFAAMANPGCTGEVDWVLQEGRQHSGCECEDLAAGGPYPADDPPTYPHPNCMCWLRPRLRDHDEIHRRAEALRRGRKRGLSR